MLVHQLLVIPTDETLAYFAQVFDGCPFDLDLRAMHVIINSSAEEMKADLDRTYVAYAGTMDKFYDSSTGETSLLLPLISPDLEERAQELQEHAPSAFYDKNFPYLVVKRGLPPLRPHRRGLVMSYAEQLYAHQQPLIFDAEIVVSKHYEQVPDLGFYMTRLGDFLK